MKNTLLALILACLLAACKEDAPRATVTAQADPAPVTKVEPAKIENGERKYHRMRLTPLTNEQLGGVASKG